MTGKIYNPQPPIYIVWWGGGIVWENDFADFPDYNNIIFFYRVENNYFSLLYLFAIYFHEGGGGTSYDKRLEF